jgi:nitrate reductase delta subunit
MQRPGWSEQDMAALRLGAFKKSPEQLEAIERVKDWTREHFRLTEDVPVLVSEIACTLPDCAPLETVVAFWTETGDRHHFKIFKPVQAVVAEDVPAHWLDDGLFATANGIGCACC